MPNRDDPRVDRVIGAMHALEAQVADQAETIERLRSDLTTAQRDAAEARESAAHAKADTASYQAELTALARRNDLDRLSERLDETESTIDAARLGDVQASALREQIAKVGKAFSKVASSADLATLARRLEQLDDRIQTRVHQLEERSASASLVVTDTDDRLDELEALGESTRSELARLRQGLTRVSGDAGDVGQSLDRRIQALEDHHAMLTERLEAMASTAEDEIARASSHLEKRFVDLLERLEVHEARLNEADGRATSLKQVVDEMTDLEDRVFGADGVAPRLMQLAQVVVERSVPATLTSSTDATLLEFQTRFEDLVSRVEGLANLRERVELLEGRLHR